ncbi:acyl-CoA dehydrogenase [Marinicella gelatinilytica]|uniref:acyl-CoA dehydrogenase n=1 Tax=Marinicella gelatinilytica TaxID=2996017 RepID=UPI002260A38F|nr:acyl-CoA dehydrogenase [Marinicella gelatinilytica]MCX7544050.1 acyl-CoA dehydrogenase [Marinicella gelatinilytica]
MSFLALLGMYILVILASAYLRTSVKTWTLATAVVLGLCIFLTDTSFWAALFIVILFAVPALFLNIKSIRQQYFTQHFLKFFRKALPQLSETERVALEAGTVHWDAELFSGKPNFKRLHAMKKPELTTEEKAFLDGPVQTLCEMLDEHEYNHVKGDMPKKVWDFMAKEKFFAMIVPKEYNGLGFSALAHSYVLQKVASRSAVAAATVAVPNSLGPAELLLHYGTEEQKNHYLPRLSAGKEIPCFGLTAPSAGSDATSIPDIGVVCKKTIDGKEVLGISLTFDKRYITLAPVATVVGLAFQMTDPDKILGDKAHLGITLALVPSDTPGMEIGRRHLPLDVLFMNGPVRGKDVFVPMDTIIGGEKMIGHGWRMLSEVLAIGRAISLPSSSTGGAKMVAYSTGAYARIRKQFNLPIGRFEGIEEALCRIAGKTYSCAAVSTMTAAAVDRGERPSVPSAIAKMHATDMARSIISDSMDIHGGKGIIMGPNNYLGRAWMGAPIWITVEGANILTRSLIIFGQGAIRCHPYVLKEMEAANLADQEESLKTFDHLLFKHMGYTFQNAVRSFFQGLGTWRLEPSPGDKFTKQFYSKITRYSASFGFASDVAMLSLGGSLKKRESTSARLGDVLSHLYMASAVLKRYLDQGQHSADQPVVAWAMHHHFYEIEQALKMLSYNFPNKAIGFMLRRVIFPLGTHELPPGDRLGHKVATLLLSPNETRDRLCDGIDTQVSKNHLVAKMNQVLAKVIDTEPLERRILKAQKSGEINAIDPVEQLNQALERDIINKSEFDILSEVRKLVSEVIAVDDFPHDAFDRTEAYQPKDDVKIAL